MHVSTTMGVRERSDAELIAGARQGDSDAFGELYRRHVESATAAARALARSHSDADDLTSEAFARVLRALQRGGGPEVSFRPYVVTTVRNVFYDKVRRNREEPSDDMSDVVNVALLAAADNHEDGALAAAAFATLPERWQMVLWHTEVEGRSVAEIAPLLGVAPNAVAALAYRAREGLRQAYLQAHLRDQTAAECRECATSLGAYVRDGLSARDRRRVDAHLDGCESCTALVAEVTDTNNTLRAALIPALIGVSSTAYLSGIGGKGLLVRLRRVPKTQPMIVGVTVAASVIAVAAFAGFFGGRSGSQGSTGPASTATAQVVPAAGDPLANDSLVNDSLVNDSLADDSVPSTDSVPTSTPTGIAPPTVTTVATPTVVPTTPTPPTTVRRPPPPTRPTVPPPTVPPATTPVATTPIAATPVATNPATTNPATTNPATTVPVTTPPTVVPVPQSMTVASQQRSAALSGGQFRLQATVTNTGPSDISGLQLDVATPLSATLVRAEALSGPDRVATFVSADAPGWSCVGNVSCTLPSLASGQSSVLQLTFAVSTSAPARITFVPSVSSPADATVISPAITVAVASVADLLVAETERGALVAIGNTVVTCADRSPNCVAARAGTATGTAQDHNDHVMQYVNTAGGTFNSSSATLALTGTHSRAYLIWSGDIDQAGFAPSRKDFDKVRFTTPIGTTLVTANRTESFDAKVSGNTGMYAAYADVTALVSGSGIYSVADVQTALGRASFGGWSLIVIDHDDSLPERFMVVTAPFSVISGSSASTSLSFGVDLPEAMVNANGSIVAVGFEGDRSLQLDQISLSGDTVNNPFRGKIDGPRDAAFPNSLGTDVVVVATSGMNGDRLAFNASSGNDRVILPLLGVALDL